MTARRIQLRRTKGWRLPTGVIKVDRSTPWGNPFVVGQDGDAEACVALYRALVVGGLFCLSCRATQEAQQAAMNHVRQHITALAGHDLACWCRTGQPCHGDVLLEIANTTKAREPGE